MDVSSLESPSTIYPSFQHADFFVSDSARNSLSSIHSHASALNQSFPEGSLILGLRISMKHAQATLQVVSRRSIKVPLATAQAASAKKCPGFRLLLSGKQILQPLHHRDMKVRSECMGQEKKAWILAKLV